MIAGLNDSGKIIGDGSSKDKGIGTEGMAAVLEDNRGGSCTSQEYVGASELWIERYRGRAVPEVLDLPFRMGLREGLLYTSTPHPYGFRVVDCIACLSSTYGSTKENSGMSSYIIFLQNLSTSFWYSIKGMMPEMAKSRVYGWHI
jgi:hypothetical protein